jgi:hypothetical protein
VDTIVRPPSVSLLTTDEPPRRRWIWRLALSLGVLIVAALIAAGTWVANYDPFTAGHILYGARDDRIGETDVDAIGVSGRLLEVPVSGPTRFRYRFSILNRGPVAVRIATVDAASKGEVTLRPVRAIPDLAVVRDGRWVFEPWHPFTLQPGHDATIEMEVGFRPRSCLPRGTTLTWWPETIGFSVLGVARTTTFESNVEVHIVGTQDC